MPEYPRVRVDELPDAPNPTAHKKEVDEALGIEAFGFNIYVAHPGERLPWGYHYHSDHEELLYVLDGELAVETPESRGAEFTNDDGDPVDDADESSATDGPTNGPIESDEAFRVEAGEALFVPPETPQCARAVGDEPARVIAVGAPKDADGAVIEEYCPTCEAATDRTHDAREDEGESVYVLFCAECGTEIDRLHAGPE